MICAIVKIEAGEVTDHFHHIFLPKKNDYILMNLQCNLAQCQYLLIKEQTA